MVVYIQSILSDTDVYMNVSYRCLKNYIVGKSEKEKKNFLTFCFYPTLKFSLTVEFVNITFRMTRIQ